MKYTQLLQYCKRRYDWLIQQLLTGGGELQLKALYSILFIKGGIMKRESELAAAGSELIVVLWLDWLTFGIQRCASSCAAASPSQAMYSTTSTSRLEWLVNNDFTIQVFVHCSHKLLSCLSRRRRPLVNLGDLPQITLTALTAPLDHFVFITGTSEFRESQCVCSTGPCTMYVLGLMCMTLYNIMQYNNLVTTCSTPITTKYPPAQWNSHLILNKNKIELKTKRHDIKAY